MGTGGKITTNGRVNAIDRAYLTTPNYTPPYQFMVGIGTTTPTISDTSLELPIPINNGTVNDDGSNNLTGSDGGSNTTNNTDTYKEGANITDDTAQNLIKNDTNATAIWTISDLDTNGNDVESDEYIGLWIYIKDDTALNKFKSSGTCLEIKFGEDSSNYYSITKEASDLSTGWNWLSSWPTVVEDLTETGTVDSDIDTFIIEITTNNSTDEFTTGDVIYDLLRTWEDDDLIKTFISGYPTIDEPNIRSTIRCYLTTIEATGFNITEIGIFNNGSPIKLITRDVFDSQSKSSTDEIAFIIKDQMRTH